MRVVQVCEKCQKETLSSDSGSASLEINYKEKVFRFVCTCGHINIFDFGNIQEALARRTKLPGLGTSRF